MTIKDKILAIVNKIGVTVFFAILYLIAWGLNGLEGTHFDLGNLIYFYTAVIAKQAICHGINSVFNSPRGTMPMEGTKKD